MRRIYVIAGCVLVLGLVGLTPAQAKVPLAVVGTGATRVVNCTASCGEAAGKVTVATVNTLGAMVVTGAGEEIVNCVQYGTFTGGVRVIVASAPVAGARTWLIFSEGSAGHKPWAIAYHGQVSTLGGNGQCGFRVGLSTLGADQAMRYQVPPNRYQVCTAPA
jgi:hypothetical protein